jgi:hypothetical protein
LKEDYNFFLIQIFRAFDNEAPSTRARIDEMEWTQYHDVDTIFAWLDSLQDEFPDWVNVTTIGTSFHGRPMKLLKISKKTVNEIILF